MIPTFSGKGTRKRNVNLSGRSNQNHLSAWAPASGFGTSSAIGRADEQRKRRQQEKLKIESAELIQRVWRRYRLWRDLTYSRQQSFDELYRNVPLIATPPHLDEISDSEKIAALSRLEIGVAWIPEIWHLGRSLDNARRVVRVATDVILAGVRASKQLCSPVQAALVTNTFVAAAQFLRGLLASTEPTDSDQKVILQFMSILVRGLTVMCQLMKNLSRSKLSGIYRLLADTTPCVSSEEFTLETWSQAAAAPVEMVHLIPTSENASERESVYRTWLYDLLTSPSNSKTQATMKSTMQQIDLALVSEIIFHDYSKEPSIKEQHSQNLWLAVHLIGSCLEDNDRAIAGGLLPALLILIGPRRSNPNADSDAAGISYMDNDSHVIGSPDTYWIPNYINGKLSLLTSQTTIQSLIQNFTVNSGKSSHELKRLHKVSGILMRLIQRFPEARDDILMRLFLSDVTITRNHQVPFTQCLLSEMLGSTLIQGVLDGSVKPLKAIQEYLLGEAAPLSSWDDLRRMPSAVTPEQRDGEWRVILLALEMYGFVLRVTDDDDFMTCLKIDTNSMDALTPRIQRCNLSLDEISKLSKALCRLALPLYYNAVELEPHTASPKRQNGETGSSTGFWGLQVNDSPTRVSVSKSNSSENQDTFYSFKLDLTQIKSGISEALRALYDRDSRRRFLPEDHWLMTEEFDISSCVVDIVLEQEHQERDALESVDQEDDGAMGFDLFPTPRNERITHDDKFKEQVKRRRMEAVMAPRLDVLRHMPFVVPFMTRVEILRSLINLSKAKMMGHPQPLPDEFLRNIATHRFEIEGRHEAIEIERDNIFESAFSTFEGNPEALKKRQRVIFMDQFGEPEAGIDGGGVGREFQISLSKAAFTDTNLFIMNDQNQYYPDSSEFQWYRMQLDKTSNNEKRQAIQMKIQEILRRYEFIGAIVGKSIYSGTLIDVSFPGFFIQKWVQGLKGPGAYKGTINDIRDLDEQTYQGLVALKQAEDASVLGLDFTIDERVARPGEPPEYITVDLIPNGDQITVTNSNRLLYTSYFSRYRLVLQGLAINNAFLRGLYAVIEPSWLRMFNQAEIRRVVGGDSAPIDLADWRANTVYSGIYTIGDDGLEHPVIQNFWKVMEEISEEDRRLMLQYVTSVPRAPLEGFKQLEPKFSIRDSIGEDASRSQERLPSAATCINLLKLPAYKNKELLKEKLMYAIKSGSGFELS